MQLVANPSSKCICSLWHLPVDSLVIAMSCVSSFASLPPGKFRHNSVDSHATGKLQSLCWRRCPSALFASQHRRLSRGMHRQLDSYLPHDDSGSSTGTRVMPGSGCPALHPPVGGHQILLRPPGAPSPSTPPARTSVITHYYNCDMCSGGRWASCSALTDRT